ncbi:adenosylcobinamide-phosphate synthase CbiB [Phaeobacter sp. 22II1-1F12B]|uniref:adenosylcobinamide-phosphate synthase CbiB n=1 Tax=Phaeobacter sp. 22II1-1F12B TaxID=1317111 RepID=UPI000B522E30|nr:adenosylcobinamide-phosphate synthase CbiB [Phaeobacter sp. 22II1-1F12B]OWU81090.1 cobalamin biosynthesis protein CobD [Phaeobacter sp. 22II1-1F12B]
MSTAALLSLALLLDGALGEPQWLWSRLPHPAVLMGRAVGWLDRTLNSGRARRAKGVLALAVLVTGAIFLGLVLSGLGDVITVLIAAILLAQRSLCDHVADVARGLRISLDEGRSMVARIVSRDTSGMDAPRIARSAIESGAENLSDGVIAPAFWFLIAGLPGLLAYKIVNTADSMIGYRNPRYESFGWAAARFDDLMNWIPARLTGFIIAALSGGLGDWSAITRDARQHRSPNAGWPEAAMARALNVALAGPRSYDGVMRDLPWVNGDGRRDIGASDVDDSVRMLWKVWRVVVIFTILAACVMSLTT